MNPEEHSSAFGVLLALASGSALQLGALAAVAFQPAVRSRPMATLLATTCGFMVSSFFTEIVPKARMAYEELVADEDTHRGDHNVELLGILYGSGVLTATILLMAVAEVLADQPVARLRKMQDLLAHQLQMDAGIECSSDGTRLADDFINGWRLPDDAEEESSVFSLDDVMRGPSCRTAQGRASTAGSEARAVTHEMVRGEMEQNNSRHLRNIARRIRQERTREESVLDTLCRLTDRSTVESDATIDVEQFHAIMRGLIATCRTRNELIWKDLCKRNGRKWPTLVVLAAALEDTYVMKRGCTQEDIAAHDPLCTEVPGLMGWALEKADRLGNIVRLREETLDGSPRSFVTKTTQGGQCTAKTAYMAHMQGVISRVRPLLEISLETICAGTLHIVTGISLGLLVAGDIKRGVVFAVLLAARGFPEGLVFAGDLMRLHRLSRKWAFFAASFVGLCDCVGASIACSITMSLGELSGLVLAAIYFVNGGIFLQQGLRKYLRAAVASDPEKEVPTIAVIFGMLLAGIFVVVYDDHLYPSSSAANPRAAAG
jgi:zinc transporter ZupT